MEPLEEYMTLCGSVYSELQGVSSNEILVLPVQFTCCSTWPSRQVRSISAHSLSDFPIFPSIKPKTSRAPPHHHFQTRKSSRVCHAPTFLVNLYKLDQPKLIKTAKTNAASGPMLKYESMDLGSNSCITFQFSLGLYTAIVHPTLSAPPQSWSLGPHQVLFQPTSIEGDINLTHTKVQIHCSLSSSSSSTNVTLSLFPTTHKLGLQGKIIPPLFVN